MNILYLFQAPINWEKIEGPHIHIWSIINELRKLGNNVRFVNLQPHRKVIEYYDLGEKKGELGAGFVNSNFCKFFESTIRRLQSTFSSPYFGFFDSIRIYKAIIVSRIDFDLIYERFSLMCYGGAILSKVTKKKLVLEVQADVLAFETTLLHKKLKKFQLIITKFFTKWVFDQADKIIVISLEVKQQLEHAWNQDPEKISIVSCGVDANKFAPKPSRFRQKMLWEDVPVIGFVGAFYPWHGVEVLVRAFSIVKSKEKTAKLLLIGSGLEFNQVVKLVQDLELQSDVVLTGNIPHEKVPDYVNCMDIAVAPFIKMNTSLWFSPLKIFEYMAAGKAIVTADSGEISRIICHKRNGLLVEPGNINQVADAILLLIDNPALRVTMGQQARKDALEKHTWESRASDLSLILSEVYSRKKV